MSLINYNYEYDNFFELNWFGRGFYHWAMCEGLWPGQTWKRQAPKRGRWSLKSRGQFRLILEIRRIRKKNGGIAKKQKSEMLENRFSGGKEYIRSQQDGWMKNIKNWLSAPSPQISWRTNPPLLGSIGQDHLKTEILRIQWQLPCSQPRIELNEARKA